MKLFFLLTFFYSSMALGQLYNNFLPPMQNAPGIKWKSIHTSHYEVVFDEELTEDAKRVANVLEGTFKATSASLKQEPTKITVLLFNQASDANGMVALAPRRSEWYTTPPGSNATFGNINWLDLLTIHEMRHVVQFDKSKHGFTKFMYVILGEFGWAIASHFAIPFWVWEGDAVGTETALSKGGRGRLPRFELPIRTILLNDQLYSYEKAYLGSFKDYFPNHYPLGYLLSSYIKHKYGLEVWEKIFLYTARKSFNPYALWNAMEKTTGRNLYELYQDCMEWFKTEWKEQQKKITVTGAETLPVAPRKGWTNYEYPMVDEAGNVYALKSGLSHISTLVKIKDGKEEELTIPGFLHDNPFNLSKTKIVWNETRFDPRWGQRTYSVIKSFDLQTKKAEQLTSKTRYFSPVYSPDEAQIAVVENGLYHDRALLILSASTLQVEKRFPIGKKDFYFTPAYFPDGKALIVLKQNDQGQSLVKVNAQTGAEEILYGPTAYTLSRPVVYGQYLYFNSHQSGIDNVWAQDLTTEKVFQVTSRPYGSYHAFVLGNKLYFNDYQFQGMEIASMELNPTNFEPAEKVRDTNIKIYDSLSQLEGKADVLENIPTAEHKVENYNHFKDLFNVHSWVIDPGILSNSLDVSLVSTNKLTTFASQLGYKYNTNEDTNLGYAQLSYAGLYPILDAQVSYGGRSSTSTINGNTRHFEWKEQKAAIDLRLPFNFTQDSYLHTFQVASGPTFIKIHDKTFREPFDQNNGTLTSLDTYFEYAHTKRTSLRDIFPEYGQVVVGQFKAMPFGTDYKGKQTSVNTFLYFPGVMDHHSFWLNMALEEQRPKNYRYETAFLLPRGYPFYFKEQYRKISFNYTYPVAFIDQNFGLLLYLKRLKQNIFYDHGVGKSINTTYYNSIGTEFTFDINLFNVKFPFDLGMRAAYLIEEQKWDFAPLFFSVAVNF